MSSVPPPQFPIRTNINAPPTCIFITPEMPARVRSIFYPIPPQPNQHPGIAAGEDQCFYCGHFGHRQERCNDAKLKKPRSAEDFEDWRRVSANPKWYSVTALWPSCAPRPRRDNTPETALTSTKAFVSALNDTSKYFDSKRYSKLNPSLEIWETSEHPTDSNSKSESNVPISSGPKRSTDTSEGSPRPIKRRNICP